MPAEGVRLLLRPDQTSELRYESWKRKIELPPCRLVWIGDVVASPEGVGTPHVQALVVLLESGEVGTITLPLNVFRFATVARVLRELPLEARALRDLWWARSGGAVLREPVADRPVVRSRGAGGGDGRGDSGAWGRDVGRASAVRKLPALRRRRPPCPAASGPAVLGDLPVLLLSVGSGGAARLSIPPLGARDARSAAGALRRPSVPRRSSGEGASTRRRACSLSAIGRDALVTYARTGRAQIRAVPPFRGPARLMAVGIPLQLGEFAVLFIQQIVESVPGEGDRGVIRWKKIPQRRASRTR